MNKNSIIHAASIATFLMVGTAQSDPGSSLVVNTDLGSKNANIESWLISTPSEPPQSDKMTAMNTLSLSLMQSARQAAEGNTPGALLSLGKTAADFWLPSFGKDLPEWAKHIEGEWEVNENNVPRWSVLGVFPLFESKDVQDTVFTQVSQRRYQLLGIERDVTNVGLGYRRLLFDNSVLVGLNGFYDYGWKYNHQRVSAGVEAKWAGLDFGANSYWKASSSHTAGAGNEEEVLDGHDIRLASQVPFLPWARVHGRRYWWKTSNVDEDIKGWEAGLEMDIHQNLQVETGVKSDNFIDDADNNEYFFKMRVTMDLGTRPVALSSQWVSGNPWLMRDMSQYRLDKVRRENKIIVERKSSGVFITRGN